MTAEDPVREWLGEPGQRLLDEGIDLPVGLLEDRDEMQAAVPDEELATNSTSHTNAAAQATPTTAPRTALTSPIRGSLAMRAKRPPTKFTAAYAIAAKMIIEITWAEPGPRCVASPSGLSQMPG